MKSRLTAAILVVAAWFTSLCIFGMPSHACCDKMPVHKAKALAECCVSQATIQVSDQQPSNGLAPGFLATASPPNPLPVLNLDAERDNLSAQAASHVPDQSGRYLELRVLLN